MVSSSAFQQKVDTLAFQILMDSTAATTSLKNFTTAVRIAKVETQAFKQLVQTVADKGAMSLENARKKVLSLDAAFAGVSKNSIVPTMKQIAPPTIAAASKIDILGSSLKSLQHVFIGMIAFRILTFFMNLGSAIGEATKKAQDFYKSMVNVTMGIRAMQRSGVDVTFLDAAKALEDMKKQFPVLSNAELADGLDNILLKTAQMGVSWEDTTTIFKIAAATYAQTGKSMESVSDALINALVSSSGNMTKTLLEQTNLQINARMLEAKARELGIKSIEKGVSALSEEERKTVALAVAWDQLSTKLPDIADSMASQSAEVEKASKAWDDLKTNLGLISLVIKSILSPYLVDLYAILEKVAKSAFFTSAVPAMVSYLEAFSKSYTPGGGIDLKKFVDTWNATNDKIKNSINGNMGDEIGKLFGDNLADGVNDALDDGLSADALTALEDFARDVEELAIDAARDLEDARIDLARKLEDIQIDYLRKLDELERDYQQDVEDANRSNNDAIEKENRDYRDAELKAERDYLRRLQQLRDDFLFNLEDALRERDARQVLRLTRQYQLDKQHLTDEYEDERADRLRKHLEELADLEKQKQERLRKLQEEYAQRRADAELDRQRSIEDAERNFQQDREDDARHRQQKLQDLVDALIEQGVATAAGAEEVRKILMQYFGPGGATDQIYDYMVAKIQQATTAVAQSINAMKEALSGGMGETGGTNYNPHPEVPMAKGGTLFASSPTRVLFGEAGPETATFTPLSKLRTHYSSGGTPPVGASGGQIQLEVYLSPDLEARIVQEAASNVASVIHKIQREK